SLIFENDFDHANELAKTGFWGRMGAGIMFVCPKEKTILLGQRSMDVEEPGTWGIFGGAVDEGEDIKKAAIREAEEETGYTASYGLVKPLFLYTHSSGFKYANFVCPVDHEFIPRLNWENKRTEWFNFGEWPTPLHFGVENIKNNSNAMDILRKIFQ
ncbi:MAG: NUDIX hydrolase, partial [Candidimonas sp.]